METTCCEHFLFYQEKKCLFNENQQAFFNENPPFSDNFDQTLFFGRVMIRYYRMSVKVQLRIDLIDFFDNGSKHLKHQNLT